MTEKEDYIHNDPSPWRDKAIELLAKSRPNGPEKSLSASRWNRGEDITK